MVDCPSPISIELCTVPAVVAVAVIFPRFLFTFAEASVDTFSDSEFREMFTTPYGDDEFYMGFRVLPTTQKVLIDNIKEF